MGHIRASDSVDWAAIMEPVARRILGEPNKRLSSKQTLRWGTNGSLAVEIAGPKRGTWHNFELDAGGGVLDLLRAHKGLVNGSALDWLEREGLIPPRRHDAASRSGEEVSSGRRIVATYDYRTADGSLLYQVVRYEPKGFRQRRPDSNGGWQWDLKDVERVPYRLSDLLKAPLATTVYVTEGEKDADALRDHVLVATTAASGTWTDSLAQYFRGRRVVILQDNDKAGEKQAQAVAAKLHSVADFVGILLLPSLPDKGDASDWLAAGGTPDELEKLASACKPFVPAVDNGLPVGLRVVLPSECEAMAPRPYLIKGLIGQGDVAVLAGQPGAGKSLLAPHMAYAVAQGRNVLGRRVKQGNVLYLSAEDGHGMMNRVRALRRRWGDTPNFYLAPDPVDLLQPDGRDMENIRTFVRHVRPALVIVETVARAFRGLRENEADDMGRVVAVAREIAGVCGSAVLLVHHVAKDGGMTPRGHGCLNGDADVTMLVEGSGGDLRTVRLGKNRNGPSDASFAFSVAIETMGTDPDGDPITAPVADEAEPGQARTARRVSTLSAPQRTALELLRRAIIDEGESAPASRDIPARVLVVSSETWRRYCYNGTITTGSTQDAQRKAFQRAAQSLQERGLIGVWGGVVWLTDKDQAGQRDREGHQRDTSGTCPAPEGTTGGTDRDRGSIPCPVSRSCPGGGQ